MIYVELERAKDGKKGFERLHLSSRFCPEHDRIFFGIDDKKWFSLEEGDLQKLYYEKKALQREAQKKREEKQKKEESEQQTELAELRAWKAEMKSKNFIRQIFTLWNMRKR